MRSRYIYILFAFLLFTACQRRQEKIQTPWGTVLEEADTSQTSRAFTLSDIQSAGELIMLTVSGPDTYFDYHGRGMGTQYLLCERFAQQIGVAVRVEVCKDTTEMLGRLERGEADLIACAVDIPQDSMAYCGPQWATLRENTELADTINHWYSPKLLAEVKKEQSFWLSTGSVTRHVYSPMLNRSTGIISKYDDLFRRYAPVCRWDWRLMAAQCYQESTFDPQARSWAGACGLMQILPSTAERLGLAQSLIFEPEHNIAAAARYIRQLNGQFADVPNATDRMCFVLASYNGGFYHIRDAMALARKYGRNTHSWADVSYFVLRLTEPAYYRDAVVKYGYMRGHETVDYVERIRGRWAQYRGVATGGSLRNGDGGEGPVMIPQKAQRRHRFKI